MKILSKVVYLTIVSFAFSIIAVAAQSSVTWSPVTLEDHKEEYYSSIYKKSVDHYSAIINNGAYQVLVGDIIMPNVSRGVAARVRSNDTGAWLYTNWVTTKEGSYVKFNSNTEKYALNVQMMLRATADSTSKVNFWGTWALNYESHT